MIASTPALAAALTTPPAIVVATVELAITVSTVVAVAATATPAVEAAPAIATPFAAKPMIMNPPRAVFACLVCVFAIFFSLLRWFFSLGFSATSVRSVTYNAQFIYGNNSL